ncbi:MAG: acyltransferase [Puniceicoccaceae bacterium]
MKLQFPRLSHVDKSRLKKLIAPLYSYIYSTRIKKSGRGHKIEWSDAILRNCNISIHGHSNILKFGKGCRLRNTEIRIEGDNCLIEIGNRCCWSGILVAEDDNSEISIGSDSTAIHATIVSSEGQPIILGDDCMISKNVDIRSSDGHSIIDPDTGKRMNPARSITIGNHVWIGAGVTILKGVEIGNGSIVGCQSLVTQIIEECSLALGIPAKVIRQPIAWKRERI